MEKMVSKLKADKEEEKQIPKKEKEEKKAVYRKPKNKGQL